ncbi:MAG: hypothetical protein LUD68_05545 [Rikenellaceae bacterium]|nr:hypothetical protein [Rikenellaceae bacterium]
MMDFIMVPAVVGICIYGIYSIFELFARRKERKAMIEKWNGISCGEIQVGKVEFSSRYRSLTWGCLLLGIGLGLLIGFLIGSHYVDYSERISGSHREFLGIVYGASVLLCGGIGMLAAFLIEYRLTGKNEK